MKYEKITLSHGSGGKAMHDLIKRLFLKNLSNPFLDQLGDSAIIENRGCRMAYTTDSFIVKPIFFPGGDIGKLSVCGVINDLSVSGAMPKYLSCGIIIEEGFEYSELEKIVYSVKSVCEKAGVSIVTGDFKVAEKGAIDGIFINMSGIGYVPKDISMGVERVKPGDKIIINGSIGEHAASILLAREELKFTAKILSDCAPLNDLIFSVICKGIRFMRDPTRGGLATTLNEISMASGYDISIDEEKIPVKKSVRSLCEILGFDPLYMANEGKAIFIVSKEKADNVLAGLRKHSLGKDSKIIGEVRKERNKRVYVKTNIGGFKILDMLTGEQLPRIC